MLGSACSNNAFPTKGELHRPPLLSTLYMYRISELKFASVTIVVPMACNCNSRIYYRILPDGLYRFLVIGSFKRSTEKTFQGRDMHTKLNFFPKNKTKYTKNKRKIE
jgi:hypothetical protein